MEFAMKVFALLLIAAGLAFPLWFAVSGICPGWTPCSPAHQIFVDALSGVVVGMGVWRWVSTARDAGHAAERANVNHSRKAATPKPIIAFSAGAGGKWQFGAEIPW